MKARLLGAPWFVCLLAAAAFSLTSARQHVEYIDVPLEGILELLPDTNRVADPIITDILWEIGQNPVAEYDEHYGPYVDYYGTYKGRTELNKETGKLVIYNMTIEDSGEYSVEVNGRRQDKTYKVSVFSHEDVEYIPLEGNLKLPPKQDHINFYWIHFIVHKYNKLTQTVFKLAEWDLRSAVEESFYSTTYKGRIEVESTYKGRIEVESSPWTRLLIIKNMTMEDSGEYYIFPGDKKHTSERYTVKVIKQVPKPMVAFKSPCSHSSTKCSLECEGDITDAGPVTFRWKKDDGEWMVSDSAKNPAQLIITNDEEGKKAETLVCEMKNPVSVKQSDPCDNPFKGNTLWLVIVLGVVGLNAVVCTIACNYLYWRRNFLGIMSKSLEEESRKQRKQIEMEPLSEAHHISPSTTGRNRGNYCVFTLFVIIIIIISFVISILIPLGLLYYGITPWLVIVSGVAGFIVLVYTIALLIVQRRYFHGRNRGNYRVIALFIIIIIIISFVIFLIFFGLGLYYGITPWLVIVSGVVGFIVLVCTITCLILLRRKILGIMSKSLEEKSRKQRKQIEMEPLSEAHHIKPSTTGIMSKAPEKSRIQKIELEPLGILSEAHHDMSVDSPSTTGIMSKAPEKSRIQKIELEPLGILSEAHHDMSVDSPSTTERRSPAPDACPMFQSAFEAASLSPLCEDAVHNKEQRRCLSEHVDVLEERLEAIKEKGPGPNSAGVEEALREFQTTLESD